MSRGGSDKMILVTRQKTKSGRNFVGLAFFVLGIRGAVYHLCISQLQPQTTYPLTFNPLSKDNDAKKVNAERHYIYLGYDFKDIATLIGVSEKTIGRWAKEYKWKDKKAAEESGPDRLCQVLLEENLAISEEAKAERRRMTSKEADIINKNANTISKFKKGVNIITAMAVFRRYNNWLVEVNLDLAKSNTAYQSKFLSQLTDGE